MPFIVNKCGVRAEGSRFARTFLVESPKGTLLWRETAATQYHLLLHFLDYNRDSLIMRAKICAQRAHAREARTAPMAVPEGCARSAHSPPSVASSPRLWRRQLIIYYLLEGVTL